MYHEPVPRLFLIDSFGFIFRAYHARARSGAPPMRTAGGFSTEAVYIFHNMVRKLVNQFQPTHIAAVFESEGPTFRDEAFEAYKANRTETPPDLLEQIPWIRKTLDAMRIPVLEYPGFEADDEFVAPGPHVVIGGPAAEAAFFAEDDFVLGGGGGGGPGGGRELEEGSAQNSHRFVSILRIGDDAVGVRLPNWL